VAPPLTFTVHGQPQVVDGEHGDAGKGLVDLEQVDIGTLQPAAASTFCTAPTGAVVNSLGSCAWAATPFSLATGA
jgi:hypothetical protein